VSWRKQDVPWRWQMLMVINLVGLIPGRTNPCLWLLTLFHLVLLLLPVLVLLLQ
jgi:hypothetical protein